ncbi:unnamed protein product, partial [Choristocarpus tenellus]
NSATEGKKTSRIPSFFFNVKVYLNDIKSVSSFPLFPARDPFLFSFPPQWRVLFVQHVQIIILKRNQTVLFRVFYTIVAPESLLNRKTDDISRNILLSVCAP